MNLGPVVFPATGVASMFVAKLSTVSTGVPGPVYRNSVIKVWPDPSVGFITVSAGAYDYSRLEVASSLGNIVYTANLPAGRKEYNVQLPASLPGGMYYIRLTNGTQSATGKILINR